MLVMQEPPASPGMARQNFKAHLDSLIIHPCHSEDECKGEIAGFADTFLTNPRLAKPDETSP